MTGSVSQKGADTWGGASINQSNRDGTTRKN